MTGTPGVAGILERYERGGDRAYGEPVPLIAHSLQCAALARAAGGGDALIAAALLHDVGHLLAPEPGTGLAPAEAASDHHEATGARLLAAVFGPEVARPVSLHVLAKRWRCTVEPEYLGALSDTSARSLVAQGGLLEPTTRLRFETHPGFADAVRLRQWDDEAKIVGRRVPPLVAYRGLLEGLVRRGPP